MLKKQSRTSCTQRCNSSGFTLIELLVTLVILSVGLLGVAGLQLRSLQSSHASYERSIATLQARDLVERMWAGICTIYDADGNIVAAGVAAIRDAWTQDHVNDGTFSNQSWSAVLTAPAAGGNVWTLTITWTGRLQGNNELIFHYFRLPPPLRPDSCP